jgi:hypothetical protein
LRDWQAKEDEAIVQILLAMQEAQPQHPATEYDTDDEHHGDDGGATDEEENENPFRQDEIADILASQRIVGGTEAETAGASPKKKWWEVGQIESSATDSFIDELGSPRLVFHKHSRQHHGKVEMALMCTRTPKQLPRSI